MNVICFSSNSNISNYIGIKFLKASKVTILSSNKASNSKNAIDLENYLRKNKISNISHTLINYEKTEELSAFLKKIDVKSTIIIPKIERSVDFQIYHSVLNHPSNKIFVEPDGDIYKIENRIAYMIKEDDVDLTVKDFIEQSNGSIIETNNLLFEQKTSDELLDYYLKNIDDMIEILKYIKPMKSHDKEYHSSSPSPYSDVDLSKLNSKQQKIYIGALNILEKNKIITTKKHNSIIEVFFTNIKYREYFAKSGTWLEHFVLRCIKKISDIHDAHSSVFFMWDQSQRIMKNEIDIMATIDNQLITLSCKDTKDLVDDYLYELESHGDILSNDGAIKIIATTAHLSELIENRAKLLNIQLIQFDGHIEAFEKKLEVIILNESRK